MHAQKSHAVTGPERIDLVDSFVIDEVATYPAFHKKVFLQEAE